METKNCKLVTAQLVGNIAKKILESATHAAVFAFVSKKVTNLMTKHEEKNKVRVEDNNSGAVTSDADGIKTSCC